MDSGLKLSQRLEPSHPRQPTGNIGSSALRGGSGANADKRPQEDNILGIVTASCTSHMLVYLVLMEVLHMPLLSLFYKG